MRSNRYLAWLGVGVAALLVVLAGPAGALPSNRVEFIRGQGSDSSVDLMQNLDRQYNNTTGCAVIPPSGPLTTFDHSCVGDPIPPSTVENWDHDVALSFFALGSSNGITMLSNQGNPGVAKIDYARSSRARRSSDNAGLRFVAYARDATPWVNFRQGPGDESSPATGVSALSLQQLKDIFVNCTITNWNQVGGANAPMIVWTSQAGSGERATFDGFLGGSSDNCIPAAFKDADPNNGQRVIFENDPTPIRSCATDPDGAGPAIASCPAGGDKASIYHLGFGAFQAFPDDATFGGKALGADLGSICTAEPPNPCAPVAPSVSTIQDGSYPFTRFIFNVYRNSFPSNNVPIAALDYIGEKGWICKLNADHLTNPKTGRNYGEEVDATISATGFVPIPPGPIGGGVSGNSKCRVS